MPELDALTKQKIDDLRAISNNWSTAIEVYELLRLDWSTGAVYYSTTAVDELSPNLPVESAVLPLIVPKDGAAHFFEIETDASLGDEEIDLEIWDAGGSFTDLVYANGEGTRAEVYLWFPAVELFLAVWQGHLRTSDDADAFYWRGRIASGFRSPDLPSPRRAHWRECQAVFGGLLAAQEEIDSNDCPYDRHLGGIVGALDPATGQPFARCPRKTLANCTERGVDPLVHLSHQSQVVTVLNGQTKGPQLYSISRGNESNLKDAVRVVMGERRVRDMTVLAFRRDYNTRTPAHGWFDAIYEACEGPILGFRDVIVSGQPAQAIHYAYRRGGRGENPINAALTTHGYSGTAILRYNYGWVDPASVSPENMRAEAVVSGLSNIRVYSDEHTFTEEFTKNRAWQIARIITDKRWGYGLDYRRIDIKAFLALAAWSSDFVSFTDPDGTVYPHQRALSDVELVERSVQQQIEDMCLAGRFSRPFIFQGKLSIVPLRAATDAELAAAPVFTDEGDNRNIIVDDDGLSTLKRSQKSDLDIPNRVEATFHDRGDNWQESVAPPAEDISQQLNAGRVLGDTSRRVVTKKYNFLGVTDKGHAVKLSYGILYFGEFDEGGILNNLKIKFNIWFMDALELYETRIIKVQSSQLARYGFEYFRIIKKSRAGNLHVGIEAQAYNHEAMLALETIVDPPLGGGDGGGGGGGGEICPLAFGNVEYKDGFINIPILPC